MVFRIASSPYTHNQRQTSRIMLLVLLAAVPGIVVQTWFFGWGTVLQLILAALTAWGTEAAISQAAQAECCRHSGRQLCAADRPAAGRQHSAPCPLVDGGTGYRLAVIIAKQLYGGLGITPLTRP
ncbi:electron transport complex protein RnfD [Raoultella terrigena]|uniref:Electron transport complex protein RnfD n=1 Tax=Raoultella terrigena TaxID=577 RepID=A0A4U9CU74_RAOTE|nr:electron transport complex protein RnfD [Raoultella terrigena]